MSLHAPLIPILLPYIGGIIAGRFSPPPSSVPYIAFSIFLCILFSSRYHSLPIKKTALFTLFSAIGYLMIILPEITPSSHHIGKNFPTKKITLTGTIYQPIEILNNRVKMIIAAKTVTEEEKTRAASGNVQLTVYDTSFTSIETGDTIAVDSLKLKKPRNFKNPGMFDYEKYLKDKGIYAIGNSGKAKNITILAKGAGFNLFRIVSPIKRKMVSFLDTHASGLETSIIKAVILGDKGSLTKKTRDMFSAAGVSHLLAISGLHIGFLATVLFYLIKKAITLFSLKSALSGQYIRMAAWSTIPLIIIYTALVGANVSSVRASIMVITYLLSLILQRENDLMNTIALAALLILFWHPQSLFAIGFQLSFAAVCAIALTYKKFINKIPEKSALLLTNKDKNTGKQKLTAYILVSISVYLATAPLILTTFNHISLYAILANIIIIPFTYLLVPSGLAICSIALFHAPFAAYLLPFPLFITSLIIKTIHLFLYLPGSPLSLPAPSFSVILFYYGAFLFLLFRKTAVKGIGAAAALFLLLFIIPQKLPFPFFQQKNGLLEVTVIDVGQGESSFITFPEGETMLIDGGRFRGNFNSGERIILPYLFDRNITDLDYMIATHPDNDHTGGLFFLMKRLTVKNFLDNGHPKKDKTSFALRRLAKRKKIPLTEIQGGDTIHLSPDITVEFLHPSENFWTAMEQKNNEEPSDNNLSVVTKITYKDVSFLFTGDIEKEAEHYLRKQKKKLQSTILKVAHHGSATSSTKKFIQAVKPSAAIISVKAGNRFRHPKKSVLKKLTRAGADIYRTDRDGAVTISTDGTEYWVQTFIKTREEKK